MSLAANFLKHIVWKTNTLIPSSIVKKLNPVNFTCSCRTISSDKYSKDDTAATPEQQSKAKELLENATTYVGEAVESEEDVWASKPYPKHYDPRRDQTRHSLRPKVDPNDTSIIMFPGQGTQFVGMGRDLLKNLPMAKDLFEEASAILKFNLEKICLEGPASELNKTIHAQAAVFVCSVGALEMLREERPAAIENCVATMGFSLGEITALTFSGAFDFETALELIKVRSEAMQLACEIAPGAMATVMYGADSQLNLAMKKAREWCIERGITDPECRIANYLYPHCKVIAGHVEALKYIEENLSTYKLRRLRRLPVSGAFHTNLMSPAVEPFSIALKKAQIKDMIIPVYSNVDGKRYRDTRHIIKQLPKQICKPVCWEQTLHIVYERPQGEHFPRTFECGPGKSLMTILNQVNMKAGQTASKVSC
uniref:[acyl-carrier-protein] S-malonyltransferase n=1 Tax=Cacopsylla melanoneura TaxID=428564 RepID=A0A8D8RYB6_9HEMI